MYYLIMNTAVKPNLNLKTFSVSKSYVPLLEKETSVVNSQFYQKLFLLLISFLTILIFPESPKELENICKSNYSRKICSVL